MPPLAMAVVSPDYCPIRWQDCPPSLPTPECGAVAAISSIRIKSPPACNGLTPSPQKNGICLRMGTSWDTANPWAIGPPKRWSS